MHIISTQIIDTKVPKIMQLSPQSQGLAMAFVLFLLGL